MTDNYSSQVDKDKSEKVQVVIRVKRIAAEGGDKWSWDKVEVLGVIKNQSDSQFHGQMEIAHYSWEPGVPAGESTIYLERYNDTDKHLWKLLEGTAKKGVSHSTPPH